MHRRTRQRRCTPSSVTRLANSCALLLAAVATGQTAPDPLPDLGPPSAVPEAAPPGTATIVRDDLRRHAYWLADDARNGRYTGSAGQLATADYVAKHFESLGLKPLGDRRGYLQSYELERLELSPKTGFEFGDHKLEHGFAVLHKSDRDKVTLRGRFAFCGNGSREQMAGSLKGRIPVVVIGDAATRGGAGGDLQAVQRYVAISQNLERAGAKAAVLCLLDDQGSLANTLNYRAMQPDHARLSFDKATQPLVKVPLMVLNATSSRLLLEHIGFADGGEAPGNDKATGKLSIEVKLIKKSEATNVVAVLEGTDRKAEAIVFSAHHDHVGTRIDGDRFNGADDNASGTAGLLEIAEAFATAPTRPARSIVFLSVSGEELGLWGSAWFADHPTWPLERIVANINIDMIGRAGSQGDKIAMQVTPSHQHEKYSTLAQDGVRLAQHFGITFTNGDQYYARSDHYNFARKGIPVVFFCDGEHPDYHQVTDEADKLGYPAMEAVARLCYWTGWQAADAKDRPRELGKQSDW